MGRDGSGGCEEHVAGERGRRCLALLKGFVEVGALRFVVP